MPTPLPELVEHTTLSGARRAIDLGDSFCGDDDVREIALNCVHTSPHVVWIEVDDSLKVFINDSVTFTSLENQMTHEEGLVIRDRLVSVDHEPSYPQQQLWMFTPIDELFGGLHDAG